MIKESWSREEKRVAKRAFKNAYEKECKDVIQQIQKRANEAKEPKDLWRLHNFLRKRIKEIEGLGEDKISKIRYWAEK